MWAFFDFGLLMPALVPAKVMEREDVKKWTNDGEYELQVRGRLREHLQYFMDTYMEPGTFNPEIQATPDKDYNFRFYTSREAYAEGIKQAALAMDYEKFKVTSERFSWNQKYHTILNSIWSTVCNLNTPGGFYGPKSDDNPRGYSSSRGWSNRYDDEGWYSRRHTQVGRRIGDTFGIPEDEWDKPMVNFGDGWDGFDDDADDVYVAADGTVYNLDVDTQSAIDELEGAEISMAEWWEYTTPMEFTRLTVVLKDHFSKKILRSMKKKNLKKHVELIRMYSDKEPSSAEA